MGYSNLWSKDDWLNQRLNVVLECFALILPFPNGIVKPCDYRMQSDKWIQHPLFTIAWAWSVTSFCQIQISTAVICNPVHSDHFFSVYTDNKIYQCSRTPGFFVPLPLSWQAGVVYWEMEKFQPHFSCVSVKEGDVLTVRRCDGDELNKNWPLFFVKILKDRAIAASAAEVEFLSPTLPCKRDDLVNVHFSLLIFVYASVNVLKLFKELNAKLDHALRNELQRSASVSVDCFL